MTTPARVPSRQLGRPALDPLTGARSIGASIAEVEMLPQRLWSKWGPNFGRGLQQRSVEEVVKQETGLKREPPRRGCGCPTPVVVVLTVVFAVVLLSAVVRCDYRADGSTGSGNGETSIEETVEYLSAEE